MVKPILIVQGGQWGSEAKGAIASWLGKTRSVDIAVRTGATNAGHTVYHQFNSMYPSKAFKMQQLPVGWTRPETTLVIGAGALIDPHILAREVKELEDCGYSIMPRLKIDRRAALHVPAHAARSKASGRHHTMGATGKGCSEALVDRITSRGNSSYVLFGDSPYAKGYDVCDTEAFLNWSWDKGAQILLEGTQGQMLDLYLGPYPYVTHKQTGPAQWLLECGLSPALPTEICMVVRTFPIRVAGNSGPMPQEISWPVLAREINDLRHRAGQATIVEENAIALFEDSVRVAARHFSLPKNSNGLDQHTWTPEQRLEFKEALSELHKAALSSCYDHTRAQLQALFEMTTVTKKLRRIARMDRYQLQVASRQCRPTWVALTFMNYLFPQYWYETPDLNKPYAELQDQREIIAWVEEVCHAPVRLVSYGPEDRHIVHLDR